MDIGDTYPAHHTYKWERDPSRPTYMRDWQDLAQRCANSAKSEAQIRSWVRVMEYLDELADIGRGVLKPKQFKDVLMLAASENNWGKRTSPRAGFTATVENEPDKRRCARCQKVKDRSDFRAEASDKKKLRYNWSVNNKPTEKERMYIHHLCSTCRYNNTRRKAFPKTKPPSHTDNLRRRMSALYAKSKTFVEQTRSSPAGWMDDYCVDSRYHFHLKRMKVIEQARDILNGLVRTNPTGIPMEWKYLLPPKVREDLQEDFEQNMYSVRTRGQPMACF